MQNACGRLQVEVLPGAARPANETLMWAPFESVRFVLRRNHCEYLWEWRSFVRCEVMQCFCVGAAAAAAVSVAVAATASRSSRFGENQTTHLLFMCHVFDANWPIGCYSKYKCLRCEASLQWACDRASGTLYFCYVIRKLRRRFAFFFDFFLFLVSLAFHVKYIKLYAVPDVCAVSGSHTKSIKLAHCLMFDNVILHWAIAFAAIAAAAVAYR